MGKFKMSKLFVIYQYPSRPIDVEADASEGSAAAAVLELTRAILVRRSAFFFYYWLILSVQTRSEVFKTKKRQFDSKAWLHISAQSALGCPDSIRKSDARFFSEQSTPL